jgi:hypothetical protein
MSEFCIPDSYHAETGTQYPQLTHVPSNDIIKKVITKNKYICIPKTKGSLLFPSLLIKIYIVRINKPTKNNVTKDKVTI